METEKILKSALDEQLMREIDKIPSEEEIGRQHSFEDSFLTFMAQLMTREQKKAENRGNWYTNSSFIKVAACLVCLVGVGTLLFTAFPFMQLGSKNDFSAQSTQESAMDTAGIKQVAPAEGVPEKGAAESEENSLADSGDMVGGTEEQGLLKNDAAETVFSLQSQSFDGEYHIETVVRNTTGQKMTYTPIYEWSYTLNGETTTGTDRNEADVAIETSKMEIKPGETITETYNLKDYGVDEGGGTLKLTRLINEKEVTLTVVLEK